MRSQGNICGSVKQEKELFKRKRILKEELKKLGWTSRRLEKKPKGCKQKIDIAERLRRETTIAINEVATLVHMGSRNYVNYLLYNKRVSNNKV
ncbi:MAG: hypothetical protein AAGA18_01215 [Verrucomicrobiota bacterium]